MKKEKLMVLIIGTMFFCNLYGDIGTDWVAYYSFNKGMQNHITGTNGSLANGAAIGYATVLENKNLVLDGVNDYANLSDFNPAGGAGNLDFSISFWTRSASSTQGNHCFVGKHSSSGGNQFLVGFWSGELTVQILSEYYRVATTEPVNTWVHWVVTVFTQPNWDASTVKVYKNNSLIATFNYSSRYIYNSGGKPWVLGQDWDGTSTTSDFFNGKIDEVRFYSKVLSTDDVAGLYNRKYGYPDHLDTYFFSIEDYPDGYTDLPHSHDHRSSFRDSLNAALSSHGYLNSGGGSISNTNIATLEDSSVTRSAMISSNTNNAEIVFFAGHGVEGGSGPFAYNGTLIPSDKAYGGYTKWVFYDACQTLRKGSSYLADAFGGNHVVFGFFSNSKAFKDWRIYPPGWQYSKEMHDQFVDTWVKQRIPMWEAWIIAIEDQWVAEGKSVKAGAIQRRATVNGKYFSGNYQRIYDTYKLALTTGSLWENSVTWGTPNY